MLCEGKSEEEAIAKAEQYLRTEYGLDSDGMELDCAACLPEETAIFTDEKLLDGSPVYHIIYSIQCVENYYFVISSKDGSLLSSDSSKLVI